MPTLSPAAPPLFSAVALANYVLRLTEAEQRAVALLLDPAFARCRGGAGPTGLPGFRELREARFRGGLRCPHCDSHTVGRWGSYRGRQRYRCRNRACRRTFNDLTRTPLAYTRRWALWPDMASAMLAGLSVRKTAARLGVAPSTAFRWRHLLAGSLERLPAAQLSGVIEGDETYFRESEKGRRHLGRKPRKRGGPAPKRGLSTSQVPVVTLIDRAGRSVAAVAGRGAPTAAALAAVLEPSVPRGSTLCSDGASGYPQFCATAGVTHIEVGRKPGSRVVSGVYHIQRINAYHQRLKGWMRRFNGVATKYLPNYVRWFVFLEDVKEIADAAAERRLLLDACAA